MEELVKKITKGVFKIIGDSLDVDSIRQSINYKMSLDKASKEIFKKK